MYTEDLARQCIDMSISNTMSTCTRDFTMTLWYRWTFQSGSADSSWEKQVTFAGTHAFQV